MKKEDFEKLEVPAFVERIFENEYNITPNYENGSQFKVIEKSESSKRLKDEDGNWHYFLYLKILEQTKTELF